MRALIGIHGFQIDHMADDLEFLANPVATVQNACVTRNLQNLSAIVTLDHGDHFRHGIRLVHQSSSPQIGL